MREKLHTPGPWVIKHDFNVMGTGRDGTKNRCVAQCGGYSSNMVDPTRENIANAHLIAAAPELLEALEDVCNFLEVLMSHTSIDQLAHDEGIGELYERIKHDGGKHTKLIAKAYGETP